MKVARFHQHGGPEVLVYEDVPEPKIKANEILLRVRACALNHLDLFVRAGIPGMHFHLPHVLGCDIAGETRHAPRRLRSREIRPAPSPGPNGHPGARNNTRARTRAGPA